MTPQRAQELLALMPAIAAHAAGKPLQVKYITNGVEKWADCTDPLFFGSNTAYRIKPNVKHDVVHQYRVALCVKGADTKLCFVQTMKQSNKLERKAKFIKWLTPWIVIDVKGDKK